MAGRVLLTGATGLIGRASVAPLVARGFEVLALSRSGRGVGDVPGIACDLLDAQDRRRAVGRAAASHLLHLAWTDGPDRWTSAANLDWAAATLALARDFATAGGDRAVMAGSCAEYDWSGPVLSEDTDLAPATLYGAAKARTGQLLVAAAPATGLSLAWARPFFVYGPGEPPGRLLGDLVRGLAAGRPVEVTDGLQVRDYLFAADLGEALAALLASPLEGPVNVASGEGTQVRDLIAEVAGQMQRRELIRWGARPRPAGDPPRIVADTGRLRQATGFRPRFSLADGVAELLRQDEGHR